MEVIQDTARAVTSKPVQRVVVNTVLLVSTATTLLFFAAVASALFFQNFVPDQVVTTPVHLQYGAGNNPYGITSLGARPMKAQQEYDISVSVSMPRSPANVDRGNFMVSLYLLDSVADSRLATAARRFADGVVGFGDSNILFASRRSALVPYVDPLVSLASRLFFLLYHVVFPASHTLTLNVPLAERVFFGKGARIPSSAYIEIEAGQTIQTYSATLVLTAQLRGLRWLMFHYRLPTYLAFTFLFWVCEIVFMGGAWVFWSSTTEAPPAGGKGVHGESPAAIKGQGELENEEEDRPHTFPTYGRQPPLKHEPEVKQEAGRGQLLSEIPFGGGEADDEDEGDNDGIDDRLRDSGLGTSYSEDGSSSLRRRSSQKGR